MVLFGSEELKEEEILQEILLSTSNSSFDTDIHNQCDFTADQSIGLHFIEFIQKEKTPPCIYIYFTSDVSAFISFFTNTSIPRQQLAVPSGTTRKTVKSWRISAFSISTMRMNHPVNYTERLSRVRKIIGKNSPIRNSIQTRDLSKACHGSTTTPRGQRV